MRFQNMKGKKKEREEEREKKKEKRKREEREEKERRKREERERERREKKKSERKKRERDRRDKDDEDDEGDEDDFKTNTAVWPLRTIPKGRFNKSPFLKLFVPHEKRQKDTSTSVLFKFFASREHNLKRTPTCPFLSFLPHEQP